MNSKVPEITIKDLKASGDLSVVVNYLLLQNSQGELEDHSDAIKEMVGAIVQSQTQDILEQLNKNVSETIASASGGIFVKSDTSAASRDSIISAISAASANDVVFQFETRRYIEDLTEFIIENYEDIFVALKVGGQKRLGLEVLPALLSEMRDNSPNDNAKQEIAYSRGVCLFLLCRYGEALKEVDPLARRAGTLKFHCLAGECALHTGQYAVAYRHFKASAPFLHDSDSLYTSDRYLRDALWHSNMGACYEALLESEAAVSEYEASIMLLDSASPTRLNLLARAMVLNNLGFSHLTLADEGLPGANLRKAERNLLEALSIREDQDDTDLKKARVLFNLAEVYKRQDNSPASMEYLDRAEGVLGRVQVPHALKASVPNEQAIRLFEAGHFREAVEKFQEARRTLSRIYGEDSEQYVLTSYSIAQALEAAGDPAAKQHLIHARIVALRTFDSRHHPVLRMIEDDLSKTRFH